MYRRVGVVDSNSKDELAVVKLGTKGRHSLDNYLNGKSKYNAYIEIEDNKGNRIKIDGVRFVENNTRRDIGHEDVTKIKKDCLLNPKTNNQLKKENRAKIRQIKGRK